MNRETTSPHLPPNRTQEFLGKLPYDNSKKLLDLKILLDHFEGKFSPYIRGDCDVNVIVRNRSPKHFRQTWAASIGFFIPCESSKKNRSHPSIQIRSATRWEFSQKPTLQWWLNIVAWTRQCLPHVDVERFRAPPAAVVSPSHLAKSRQQDIHWSDGPKSITSARPQSSRVCFWIFVVSSLEVQDQAKNGL